MYAAVISPPAVRLVSSRSVGLLLALALCACGAAPPPVATLDWQAPTAPTAAPAALLPRLRVEGTRLVRETDGAPVRLRGVNVCSLEYDRDGKKWELDGDGSGLLKTLCDRGRWSVNAVRVPVNQQWFLEDDDYVRTVERLLDEANDRGAYVLLDVQWEVGRTLDPYHRNILPLPTFGEGNTTEAFWHKATSRWANRTNLLLDLINEPHDHGEQETSAALQVLVDAIRGRSTEPLIVVGGPDWAHSVDGYRTRPLRGENLVYSAHQYLPYDAADGFERRFGAAAAVVPVLVGEFLASPEDASYATSLVTFAEGHGVNGWFPWAVGCGFEKDSDLTQEPFTTLARTMRELNAR